MSCDLEWLLISEIHNSYLLHGFNIQNGSAFCFILYLSIRVRLYIQVHVWKYTYSRLAYKDILTAGSFYPCMWKCHQLSADSGYISIKDDVLNKIRSSHYPCRSDIDMKSFVWVNKPQRLNVGFAWEHNVQW